MDTSSIVRAAAAKTPTSAGGSDPIGRRARLDGSRLSGRE
jgi:hypothetical protein